MPKVREGYFEDKKNAILDIAEKICAEKPLYKVTMKDIIKETGLSPGAMYASFSDVDEVIFSLISRINLEIDFTSDVERILKENGSPEEQIEALIFFIIELINVSIDTYGKIFSELAYLAISWTDEKKNKFAKDFSKVQGMYDYISNSLTNVIEENITSGYFRPIVSKRSIYAMIFAFMDGLVRDLVFARCYKIEGLPMGVTFEEKDLPAAITISVIHLLNGQRGD